MLQRAHRLTERRVGVAEAPRDVVVVEVAPAILIAALLQERVVAALVGEVLDVRRADAVEQRQPDLVQQGEVGGVVALGRIDELLVAQRCSHEGYRGALARVAVAVLGALAGAGGLGGAVALGEAPGLDVAGLPAPVALGAGLVAAVLAAVLILLLLPGGCALAGERAALTDHVSGVAAVAACLGVGLQRLGRGLGGRRLQGDLDALKPGA